MKKLIKGIAALQLYLSVCTPIQHAIAQCSLPLSETCMESSVFCSLNQLNGAFCTNGSSVPSPCSPLCSQGGASNGTSWWGFVSQGGQATFTLHVGNCTKHNGVQWGIWGDCVCGEEVLCRSIPCVPQNSSDVASATLKPCKTYYLWLDGCNTDQCDFTINTSGGAAPTLAPLGFINNQSNMIIEPVCYGVCDFPLFVNPQPGGCEPTYVWTLDGTELEGHSSQVKTDFPDYGDFKVCVTAFIGNPISGSVCTKEGPRCATVKVRPLPSKVGLPRTICWEAAHPSGYKWHSKLIYNSGTYLQEFRDANCCYYDSAVYFTVLDIPDKPDVYYITCNGTPYVDALGRSYTPCKDHYEISFPKFTNPFKCDSAIKLTAINVNFDARWKAQCQGGQIELSPNIAIVKPCSAGETYQFDYKWYKKSDPKNILSSDERLLVEAITADYSVDVTVRVELGTEIALCTKTYSESFNEGELLPNGIPINGVNTVCINGAASYRIDTNITYRILNYIWKVNGGIIDSKKDTSSIHVKWNLPYGDTGTVCLSIVTDCGKSMERCMKVTFGKESAGGDFKQRGLIAKMNSPSLEPGNWRLVSGPGTASFENPSDPKSKVHVYKYGNYCFEWRVQDTNCLVSDTICIQFYKAIYIPSGYYEDRNQLQEEDATLPTELFTSNLISNTGFTDVTISGDSPSTLHYIWYDHTGRILLRDVHDLDSDISRIKIQSPIHSGFYLLLFELNGQKVVRKICVMEGG